MLKRDMRKSKIIGINQCFFIFVLVIKVGYWPNCKPVSGPMTCPWPFLGYNISSDSAASINFTYSSAPSNQPNLYVWFKTREGYSQIIMSPYVTLCHLHCCGDLSSDMYIYHVVVLGFHLLLLSFWFMYSIQYVIFNNFITILIAFESYSFTLLLVKNYRDD